MIIKIVKVLKMMWLLLILTELCLIL